ncbi:putative protein OS=Tsukamurella paurometabola (strain ATCC 8368 / DSM / CCUG 35730 /CIP 100753 / JCM 10117 / KCTC 9821 / NBRC 16120 / NCIMB 702349/ NCTC 13040) OX=521096 GN=Tpau_1427 PE=4 SV=1 [Tsukamurella paurometabola]|uniref:Uncharacterized protein n=1 Tax=Tsukamurella paurometabola (strain ATCC 8368 / DSM 20162 / CCUG 35730 / CIP 100753 / JCM 10117 / KCTC 9821 / NBRC 16120 / NCIMB 702349 / NCTC 13040) TaxID=521096 RepID=D5UXG3_TSUPD|nr:hypothetical protein [Tsukamurella paurometabola]ADG78055.1 hypothetical protein Tpau_1427 [Tsukamurella paurometabola DSM 20162]SUP29969.1 Uncharacterised protein [Tsukamurella paurometabola]
MILPDSARGAATDDGEPNCTTTGSNLTVAQAVGRLCAFCAEQWKDYLHARAGQRDAEYRWQQLIREQRHAEEGQYLSQHDLDELNAEVDRADRLMTIRASIAHEAAITASTSMVECSRCHELEPALLPPEHARELFGGEE